MEIKYTIEILTKDIQDIEKLVGNLQNSMDGSAIELDLAMAKLRNVYEILTMIKADRLHELISPQSESTFNPQTEVEAGTTEPQPEAQSEARAEAQPEARTESHAEAQPEARTESQAIPLKPEEKEAGPVEIQSETKSVPSDKKEAEILGEKFSAESSINENLAGKRIKDIDSKLVGQPINNIGRNIGINDRFLIIRELFDGDADGFSNMVSNLDEAGSYHHALEILEKQFPGSMAHEGIEILTGLVKRRFTPSSNV